MLESVAADNILMIWGTTLAVIGVIKVTGRITRFWALLSRQKTVCLFLRITKHVLLPIENQRVVAQRNDRLMDALR